jgi:hypothetical protein
MPQERKKKENHASDVIHTDNMSLTLLSYSAARTTRRAERFVFFPFGRRYCLATRDTCMLSHHLGVFYSLFLVHNRGAGFRITNISVHHSVVYLVSLGSQTAEFCHGLAHFDV